jgi:ABC-2 type transport system ATP-binding protein
VFEGDHGVHDLDLEIPAGTIFGFIGPSGSGKTTAVRLLTGALRPDSGKVRVLGADPLRFSTAQRTRLGYMPQLSVLYPDLTVEENLRYFASISGMSWRRKERIDEVLEFVELDDHRDKKVSEISGGMRRRLSLAAALVHRPEVVFLDEPTAGIDPVLRRKFWDRFRQLADDGRTLFVTTQYVGEAAYCDRVGVLADGRLLEDDTPEGLRRGAFGGEILDVEFGAIPDDALVAALASAIGAVSTQRVSAIAVRLVVDDASRSLPDLLSWCAERDVSVESAEQSVPSFDDVFVEMVEKHRGDER